MQLGIEPYKAIAVGRGANLDTIDLPLNNRLWLKRKFEELRKLSEEADRLKGLDEINWTDPGPGGFYDDLGNRTRQIHLVKGPGFETDPVFLQSVLVGFAYRPDWHRAWWIHAESLNDCPLALRYTELDSTAEYKLRVVYAGDSTGVKIRLLREKVIPFESRLRPRRYMTNVVRQNRRFMREGDPSRPCARNK